MFKSCSRCGKIHKAGQMCAYKRIPSEENEKKLRSRYAWTIKSQQIRERANHLCEVCRDEGVYTFGGIEVHHIVKVKEDERLLLDDSNLICLCKRHHMKADNGEIDRDYLRKLARQRDTKI